MPPASASSVRTADAIRSRACVARRLAVLERLRLGHGAIGSAPVWAGGVRIARKRGRTTTRPVNASLTISVLTPLTKGLRPAPAASGAAAGAAVGYLSNVLEFATRLSARAGAGRERAELVSRGSEVCGCRALRRSALPVLWPAPLRWRACLARCGAAPQPRAQAQRRPRCCLLRPGSTAIRTIRRASAARRRPDSARPRASVELPTFGYQPALGAGTTGFDSTNARRKRSRDRPNRREPRAGQRGRPGSPAAGCCDAERRRRAAAPGLRPKPSPERCRQPAAPLAAAQLQSDAPAARRRATVDAAIATVATTPPRRRPLPEENAVRSARRPGRRLHACARRSSTPAATTPIPARNSTPPAPARGSTSSRRSCWSIRTGRGTSSPPTCAAATPATTPCTSLNRPNVDAKVNGRIDVTATDPHRSRRPLPARHRQSRQPEHPGRARPSADLHDARRHRRRRPALQPLRGHRSRAASTAPSINDSDLHRRHDRQQRRPQLQPLRPRAAHQLRAHAGRQAVRRGRRRHAASTISRSTPAASTATSHGCYAQGRHDLRASRASSPARSRSAI